LVDQTGGGGRGQGVERAKGGVVDGGRENGEIKSERECVCERERERERERGRERERMGEIRKLTNINSTQLNSTKPRGGKEKRRGGRGREGGR